MTDLSHPIVSTGSSHSNCYCYCDSAESLMNHISYCTHLNLFKLLITTWSTTMTCRSEVVWNILSSSWSSRPVTDSYFSRLAQKISGWLIRIKSPEHIHQKSWQYIDKFWMLPVAPHLFVCDVVDCSVEKANAMRRHEWWGTMLVVVLYGNEWTDTAVLLVVDDQLFVVVGDCYYREGLR
jgi:hypothetical protein